MSEMLTTTMSRLKEAAPDSRSTGGGQGHHTEVRRPARPGCLTPATPPRPCSWCQGPNSDRDGRHGLVPGEHGRQVPACADRGADDVASQVAGLLWKTKQTDDQGRRMMKR